MKYTITSASADKQRSGCVVAAVFENRRLSPAARRLDEAMGGAVTTVMRRGDIAGKSGQTLLLADARGTRAERVLLVGCGRERALDERSYREAVAAAARALQGLGCADAVSYLPELPLSGRDVYWKVRQAIEVTDDALYRFDELKSKPNGPRRPLRRLALGVPARADVAAGERAVTHGEAIAAGVRFAKDLANRPGNVCTPAHLAEQARGLAARHRRIKVTVLERAQMEKLGMGALLAVARGSREPPKLIVVEYRGARARGAPVALVGKGVTFDSGGISIKPAASMDEMKFDMSGAASVLGATLAAAELELPLDLVTLVPATENLPGGNAIKPGDVVTSMSGKTIEILNTDAEGRLILCDAITYAERYEPDVIIDVATLTGACVVALGKHASGLFSNHQPLAEALLEAGRASWDRAWQLPLWEEYQKSLDSNFADFANVGGREAGVVTAACFLARFAEKRHWAHLDIAGTAYRSGKEKGATGRPVPLLVQYLLDRAA